jgi:hypothetical protein
MDIPGTELFIEILVAGVLFTVGLSPLFPLFSEYRPTPRAKDGSSEGHQEWELFPGIKEWTDLKPWMIVAVAIVYSLGVGGNRLVEAVYQYLPIVSYHEDKKADTAEKPTGEVAEAIVRAKGVSYLAWIERHKSYRKILRAGSASSLLFLLSVGLYLTIRRGRRQLYRDRVKHCLVAGLLLIFFTAAYRIEDEHYKTGLWRMYDQLPVVSKEKDSS